jgi:hypothetical protein
MNALDRDLARRTPTAAAFAEELEQVIQAAGGETLEAWAERVLAPAREAHRAWLASVVEGTQLPTVVGRATGQVTELAPLGTAKTVVAQAAAPIAAVPPVIPDAPATDAATSIGGTSTDALSVPPRPRIAPLAVLLLALLTAGGAVYLFTRKSAAVAAHDAAVFDAPLVAVDAMVLVPVPGDAGVPVDAPTDAPIDAPIDAGRRVVTVRPDAGTLAPRPDAAVALARPDAAVAPPPPTGHAPVTIKYKPGGTYANISIDGAPGEPGPIYKRQLAAGRHTIKFLDPKTGQVLDEQTITVEDEKPLEVRQRE